ncbi:MAG: hypothetical protein FWF56_03620 [Firmicutes bacterium]|nr:hypothetical protein [Bacillota bacterium]
MTKFKCVICTKVVQEHGNNPSPLKHSGQCCDACNMKFVVPYRLTQASRERSNYA